MAENKKEWSCNRCGSKERNKYSYGKLCYKCWYIKNKESILKRYYNKREEIIAKQKAKGWKSKSFEEMKKTLDKNPKRKLNSIISIKTYHKYGKAKVCSKCGSLENVEHHHYTEPYEVDKFVDLCIVCHRGGHRKNG